MAISEELQRRISSLTGEETPMRQGMMMSADGQRPFADISLPESLSRRQPDLGIYQNQDIKEILTDFRTQASAGNAREASEAYLPRLEEMTGLNRNDPDFRAMLEGAGLTGGSGGRMSDQDMNMMIANQGARRGVSPVEQRAMAFTSYLDTTDRTAPEEVVNNYAMGNMSFDDAIKSSQPTSVVDEVVVTGQMPDMAQEQRQAMAAGMTTPVGGGAVSNVEMSMMQPSAGSTGAKMMELQQALQVLQEQMNMTSDPEEKELLGRMIENATTKAFAPQADLVDQLSQGAGEDDMMAHVRSGDVNVSREMIENNPALEDAIEGAALEVGIDPESMVYGTGIASLNEVTGAEQHGFLKKIAKGVKKVVKVIAPVAAVVPGPWQAPAIAYNRGRAVVNIAKGKGGIGDLMTAAAGVGDKAGFFGGTPSFNPTAGATSTAGGGISDLLGRAKEFILPGADNKGLFKNVIGGVGKVLGMSQRPQRIDNPDGSSTYVDAQGNPITKEQYEAARNTPDFIKGIEDTLKGQTDPQSSSLFAKLPSMPTFRDPETGQLSGMGMLGIGALATGLGKLAYEDTKKDKGVQLTPLTTMNAAGRYNLEAEIARRMGQQAPNPTEFGLLPANTMPQLSGGQPRLEEQVMAAAKGGEVQYPNKGLESLAKVAPDVVKRMGYNMGGYVMPMAYAEGGNVAIEDFERMNGQINGEGTETSDDVPAMLSDGEFVMTGQAVRGAGSYDMKNDSGIITLSPTGAPSRDGGTDLMYQLMEAFSSQARPA